MRWGCIWLFGTSLLWFAGCDQDCADVRHFGDGLQVGDTCWDPPRLYCAQGGSTVQVFACDPAFDLCCTFATTCVPCGWIDCTKPGAPSRCGMSIAQNERCIDAGLMPNDAAICVDE